MNALIEFRRSLKALEAEMGRIVFYDKDGYPLLDSAEINPDGSMRDQ